MTEKPVSSLVNFRFLDMLSSVCDDVDSLSFGNISMLRSDLPEIYSLYKRVISSGDNTEISLVNSLMRYIVAHVTNVHANDQPTAPTGSFAPYNPPKDARAYYFTKHGRQTRLCPKYSDKDSKESDPDACNKYSYAVATRSGSTYLYFMFDPLHYGHCYGFHMIENEGPKDVFCPPYLYMETEEGPLEMIGDNACLVEEYALNREPRFWRKCRFCHDCFHGYHHKCPFTYNTKRIPGLSGINTEICEHFNSYMKKIRYSAMFMSQTRFTFFVQFFIYMWNKQQREAYIAKQEVADLFLLR